MRSLAARLALGCALTALAISVHSDSSAFSLTGDSLQIDQRDLRVFDNFTDPGLHENLTPHPNWPGYLEVELAAWKAAAEWGSGLMGNGSGDPLEGSLGSGEANFDFFWNGEANGIGSTNDNIVSQIQGPGGGVCAFLELPTTDGWRMRFYGDCAFNDGPDAPGVGQLDFQGVMTHELGHALGLGHSSVFGATMFPSLLDSGVAWRSIESDDQAGVQAIYGVRNSALQPRIDLLRGSTMPGGTAVLVGSAFATTGNEVWLNNALLDGGPAGGNATRLSGLTATAGGTQLSFTVPQSSVESGAVHVLRSSGGGDFLSEAHPFQLGSPLTDTILLSGPQQAQVGHSVTYEFRFAPPNAPYALLYSLNISGSTILGQSFDLGAPITIATQGTTTMSGLASWTSSALPPPAAGLRIYLEAGVLSAGQAFDSNVVQLDVQ